MPPHKLVQAPTSSLRPNPANVRTHSKKQIRQIERSIQEFGFTAPIVVDETSTILSGHGRWFAAQNLGLTHVPVIKVCGLTDAQRRAYCLADNKIALNAGYDRHALAIELRELTPLLADCGLDIYLTGFETAEIDSLVGDLIDPEQDPADYVPSIDSALAVSTKGNVWMAGDHRVLCGDARDSASFQALMSEHLARMVFTDPPYNVRVSGHVGGRGRTKHREFAMASGSMPKPEFIAFLRSSLERLSEHVADGAILFVCIDWRHIDDMLMAAEGLLALKNICVWVKTNAGQGSFYRSQHEFVCVFKKGDAPHTNNFGLGQHGRSRSNVWTYAGVNTFKAGRMDELTMHPTVKPIALVQDAILDCSGRGDIVLDSFLGSGSTLMAAEKIGRRVYGIELDPLYVDVTIRRWQAYTRRDAILEATGETFNEIADRTTKGG